MDTVDILPSEVWLSRLIDQAGPGDEITLSRDGRPVARLVVLTPSPSSPRVLGSLRGKFTVPDDFDAPLPDAVLEGFEGH
jgi:antitoxin (DNA-binding transcriptional repressor) of toxin-antitoxin stability system